MKFSKNFLRQASQEVVDRLNSGRAPLLNEFVDSWILSRRNHARWERDNPKLQKKFDRVTVSTSLDDPISLFLKVAYAPPSLCVEKCRWCGTYFLKGRGNKFWCSRDCVDRFRARFGRAMDFYKKLLRVERLAAKCPAGVEPKEYLASRGITRKFLTRATHNDFLSEDLCLTQKVLDLVRKTEFGKWA